NPAKPDQPLVLHASSPLFAQVTVEARSFTTNQVQEDHGIRIQRQYQRLDENNEPQPLGTPRVGDRILVTLRVAVPEPATYVAVEDPLPSLFEAVNTEFKTQQLTPGRVPTWMTQDDSDSWWSDFREIRTDRVLFFANSLERGSYAIRYVARV